MNKRLLALGLAVVMLAALAGCGSKTPAPPASQEPEATPPPADAAAAGQLVVGVGAMNGDFFDGWTYLSANADVMNLINGYGTVAYTDDDYFMFDPVVVKNVTEVSQMDGSVTLYFEINEGLTYNDGTPVKAKDYVFSALLHCSPALIGMGNESFAGYAPYLGFEEYTSGRSEAFAALQIQDEYGFSITIAAETNGEPNFPFWYELTYFHLAPLPMHILAPGCEIESNADGAKITGGFGTDMLKSTLDSGSEGYRYHPGVTCGPYTFIRYDSASLQIVLEANEHYAGAYDGARPHIQRLVLKLVEDATMIDELGVGEVDLLTEISGAANINHGLDLVDDGKIMKAAYAHNGYGKLTFHCDHGPTQFEEVRRAIAWCLDREDFVRQYTGGYGVLIHSRVGQAQWMYREHQDYLDQALTIYTLDPEKAKEELIAGGWVYTENGGAYDEAAGGLRHKQLEDGTYIPLIIDWFCPSSNPIGEMLGSFIIPNAESAGMRIRQDFGDSVAFGHAVYGTGEKRYHMIGGGGGFDAVDSPWYYYIPDPVYFGTFNQNFILDAVLAEITQELKRIPPGDYDAYSEKWLVFIERFNKILPDLPLYSDEYHDLYNPKLKNYRPSALWPWTEAILRSYLG